MQLAELPACSTVLGRFNEERRVLDTELEAKFSPQFSNCVTAQVQKRPFENIKQNVVDTVRLAFRI